MRKIRIGDSCDDKKQCSHGHRQLSDYQSSIDSCYLTEYSYNSGFIKTTIPIWINVGIYQKERLNIRNQNTKPLYNTYRECSSFFDEKCMHHTENFAIVENPI